MSDAESRELPHGLYALYWRGGGVSLAAVGSDAFGGRWFAPANWLGSGVPCHEWDAVERAELIQTQGEESAFDSGWEGEVKGKPSPR